MNREIRFEEIPKEWGILVPRSGHFRTIKTKDLDLLRELRDRFRDEYYGKPVPYKEELSGNFECKGALHRLWGAGFVEKFSTTLHTLSGRPNYISWYIWEDANKFKFNSEVPQFLED